MSFKNDFSPVGFRALVPFVTSSTTALTGSTTISFNNVTHRMVIKHNGPTANPMHVRFDGVANAHYVLQLSQSVESFANTTSLVLSGTGIGPNSAAGFSVLGELYDIKTSDWT